MRGHVRVRRALRRVTVGKEANVLDFVAAMDGLTIRDAALRLAEWFEVSNGNVPSDNGTRVEPCETVRSANESSRAQLAPGEKSDLTDREARGAENKALGFALRIDPSHPYPRSRNLSPQTIAHFGVGFCGKGSMSGRIVVPIANRSSEIVAYVGRSVDGSEPKYKFPAGFHKSLELFNLSRVLTLAGASRKVRRVIVVEGFFDAMRVHESGFPNVVALMGCSMSCEQENLLASHFKTIILALDGDEAGKRAVDEIALRLMRRCFVRIAEISDGRQPDELSDQELRHIFGSL